MEEKAAATGRRSGTHIDASDASSEGVGSRYTEQVAGRAAVGTAASSNMAAWERCYFRADHRDQSRVCADLQFVSGCWPGQLAEPATARSPKKA